MPNDQLLEKLKGNLQEGRARGGELYVLADADTRIESKPTGEFKLCAIISLGTGP